MPGWPSGAERRELGAFPGQTGPEDVSAFFELSPEDLRFALSHRGEARLGVAVQLCSLRWDSGHSTARSGRGWRSG